VIVVCDPDVIVFSVKEIAARDTGQPAVDWARWQRKAIDASAMQLYGGARELEHLDRVVQESGAPGLALPPIEGRRVHLVAVAAGSKRGVPMYSGDLGKGHVHVLDEVSLEAMLRELDTVSDFVSYLTAIRSFHELGGRVVMMGGEENLLALYLPDAADSWTGSSEARAARGCFARRSPVSSTSS
jgi:hypothetical protein